ncbi:MAG: type II toxin-antitoxin system HicA family toxin [Cyanobacteria bacterium J06639_1]
MKRSALLKHLRRHGCILKREGSRHSIWMNPQTGDTEAIPRHTEIKNSLAKVICRGLSIPDI